MAILQEEGPESDISTDDDVGEGLDLPGLGKGTPG
jgi:hypothetical protein